MRLWKHTFKLKAEIGKRIEDKVIFSTFRHAFYMKVYCKFDVTKGMSVTNELNTITMKNEKLDFEPMGRESGTRFQQVLIRGGGISSWAPTLFEHNRPN